MKEKMSATRYLTLQQFARAYEVDVEWVKWAIRQGRLNATTTASGRIARVEAPEYLEIPDNPADDWYILHENEIAEIVGITPRMLRMLADEGKIRPRRIPKKEGALIRNGKRRYSVSDLRTIIAARIDPATPGHERREKLIRWAIERITGQPCADLHSKVFEATLPAPS